MPYFPRREEKAYFCSNCNKWYIPSGLSCRVKHPPGSCCHLYETESPMPKSIKDMNEMAKELYKQEQERHEKKKETLPNGRITFHP